MKPRLSYILLPTGCLIIGILDSAYSRTSFSVFPVALMGLLVASVFGLFVGLVRLRTRGPAMAKFCLIGFLWLLSERCMVYAITTRMDDQTKREAENVAEAVEKYRNDAGHLPETLAVLGPGFGADGHSHGILGEGHRLHYRVKLDGGDFSLSFETYMGYVWNFNSGTHRWFRAD